MSTPEAGPAPYTEREPDWRPQLPWWAWIAAPVAIFAAGIAGVQFTPEGTSVAVWWPAAGLSVLFGLLQPRERMPWAIGMVLIVTAIANAVAGRPLLVSLVFGFGNALEVLVVLGVVGAVTRRFELTSLRAGIRFAVAVVAGAAAAGVVAALAVALLEGGDLWSTIGFVAASHAAAVVLIAPLGALPRPVPVAAGVVEMLVQAALLAGVIAVVFHPSSSLPLAFAPFPLLAWAALRFSIRVVLAESVLAALAMLVLTLDGGGPFRREGLDLLVGAAMFEMLLVTFGGFAVVLSSAQYELRALSQQVEANNRLLTGSVVDAQLGLVIAERGEEATRVTWMNRAGRQLLAPELVGHGWAGPLRSAAMAAVRTGEQVTVTTEEGRTITVAANPISGSGERIAVQLLDVTAVLEARRTQLEAAIERDAARAIRAELERQRDDFLVTTSHELRTPITSIVGYAELLAGGDVDERERKWLEVIDRNAHRLSELVEDLLTLGRGPTERPAEQLEQVPCDEVLDEVVDNLRIVAAAKGLTVTVAPTDLSVHVSRSDVSRMLSNLLMNACKFTPAGGSIQLSAHDGDGVVRILIADNGPGMSEEELGHAFDRFYRAPSAERDSVAGTGLGLAIVAELAQRNRGSVALRANGGGGVTAELVLPAAPQP